LTFIKATPRYDVLLFPQAFDDYVSDDNPVRFIEAFVDNLDLHLLGFSRTYPAHTGRPAYSPADLLKLYIYGYLNRTRSSRLLEREAHRNLELIWLMRKLRPDFKTIADFRRDNTDAIKRVCREFTLLCKRLVLQL
jgi:transposase